MVLDTSRTPQPRPRSRRRILATGALLGVLTLALVLAGCSDEAIPDRSAGEATDEPTLLADYDTTGVVLTRGDFCDRVAEPAITAALGRQEADPGAKSRSWQPGSRLPGGRDISNEFGCSWKRGSMRARAWVFAPPVTPQRAGDFAEESIGPLCRRLRTAPDLGESGLALSCAADGGAGSIRLSGLLDDAWVGCEISGTDDVDVVGAWCVAVLEALRAT